MLDLAPPPKKTRTALIAQELDRDRQSGPLRQIVIPPCPALLTRLRTTMAQPEPDLHEIARIAGSDVAMAATLIRNANSPLHAVGQPVQTIGQAMNRLGLKQTEVLLTGFLARHAIPVNHPQLRGYWDRTALRAAAMHFIAGQLPGISPEVAHLYGLFCHVGIPVLLQSVRGYAGTLVEAKARIDRPFIATENANHRTDHAVVGALVARAWRLAPPVVTAIRLHHDLVSLGDQGTEPEVHTLVAAGLLAEHLMRRREGAEAESDWVQHSGAALRWLQFSEDDIADWDQRLQAVLDAV
jgi:HD-like signal output (HDOD) protein